jgi:hypothetical protein
MAPSGFFQPLVQPCFVDASGAAHDGIEQAGAEASGLVTGQINHDGDGPIDPDSAGPPNVLVHPKGFTLVSRCGSPVRAFASISMAFQAVCQSTPRCRASAETVVSSWARASVAQRGGAMSWISLNTPIGHAGFDLIRLHRHDQPAVRIIPHVEHVHAGSSKDRIGSGAPARTRVAHRVGHRRVLRGTGAWSPLILKAPTPRLGHQHATARHGHTTVNSEDPENDGSWRTLASYIDSSRR